MSWVRQGATGCTIAQRGRELLLQALLDLLLSRVAAAAEQEAGQRSKRELMTGAALAEEGSFTLAPSAARQAEGARQLDQVAAGGKADRLLSAISSLLHIRLILTIFKLSNGAIKALGGGGLSNRGAQALTSLAECLTALVGALAPLTHF